MKLITTLKEDKLASKQVYKSLLILFNTITHTLGSNYPFRITSYKDFIKINKEIITTIKETTNKIINNQL